MATVVRILIADRNRYHRMLMEREILTQIPGAVCTQLHEAARVPVELTGNHYDMAIVDSGIPYQPGTTLLKSIRSLLPQQPIILTAPESQFYPEKRMVDNGYSVLVVKDGTFHLRIPPLIKTFLKSGSFKPETAKSRPRMSSRRKADVINIAASTLAHEINNPLMTILGMTELLLEDKEVLQNGSVSRKVGVIQESARRIQERMNDLASISTPQIRHTVAGGLIKTGSSRDDK